MKCKRLFAVLCTFLMVQTGNAQWAALARLFGRSGAEAAAARAAARSMEEAAAARMITKTYENVASHSLSNSLEETASKLKTDFFDRQTSAFEHKTLSGFSYNNIGELTGDEQKILKTYLDEVKSPIEIVRLRYMSKEELKRFIARLKEKPKPNVTTGYQLYSQPHLEYNDGVIEIQKELRKRGYKVKVDGLFGDQTKLAVSKALRKNAIIEFPHEQALQVSKRDLFKRYKSKFLSFDKNRYFSRLEFNHNNNLVLSRHVNLANAELKGDIINFYNDFFRKFDTDGESFSNSCFLTVYNTEYGNYLGYHYKNAEAEGINGVLFDLNNANPEKAEKYLNAFFRNRRLKKVYVYGDDLSGLDEIIKKQADKFDIDIINRNTIIKKSFNKAEAALKKIGNRKLNRSKMSFLNGTPKTEEEVTFQSFSAEHTKLLQSLHNDINEVAMQKSTALIQDKDALINEFTTGTNDVLFIVAHCDAENLYFGSSVMSMAELKSLPTRSARTKPRIAVLFSCSTGDIYRNMLFANKPQSFAEALLEKNFFDMVIAPPGTIDGAEVLRMTEIIDKFPVLKLNKQLGKLTSESSIYSIAEAIESIKKNNDSQMQLAKDK